MHLYLTDRLSCPRCGPEFGLILLARRTLDQRVLDGDLGCPNCREQYPVGNGFADLRPPPRTPTPEIGWPPDGDGYEAGEASDAETLRMAAAMGVARGPGTLMVFGPAARLSGALSRMVEGVEVVGIHPALEGVEEGDGVTGGVENSFLAEAFRLVLPGGRMVVFDAVSENVSWVEQSDATILLKEDGVLVVKREEVDTQPLVTLRGI